ncbi:MAG: HU family DNA-binding protein [Paludibacter sp.]|nr:HU family DNA-binding protein [Bacteroidales bacterium]MCM1068439.1 HU family DNA-binding protein [Prevotella sp.]MCM1353393.1 HU family DNA-binding protein [Bacteroides sp.]MCM1442554.1 HU family DNA-binding protein [Muribaculum sp.]MCM1481399.1 HU family DNA-binding protein [Paludibacter sp.]
MNKVELVAAMATEAGLTKVDAQKALEAGIKTISEALAKGDSVQLLGFGTFAVAERAERTGINPQTKQTITIAAKKVVKFKAGKALTDKL